MIRMNKLLTLIINKNKCMNKMRKKIMATKKKKLKEKNILKKVKIKMKMK